MILKWCIALPFHKEASMLKLEKYFFHHVYFYNSVATQNQQNIHKINTMALLYVIDSSSQHV